MTTYTADLLLALAHPLSSGDLSFSPEHAWLDATLNERFAFSDGRIDWRHFEFHRVAPGNGDRDAHFLAFLMECEQFIGGGTKSFYLNDNLLDGCLVGKFSTLVQHMDAILEIPAHHYVVDSEFGWLIAYTFEGDIDFGKSPSPTS